MRWPTTGWCPDPPCGWWKANRCGSWSQPTRPKHLRPLARPAGTQRHGRGDLHDPGARFPGRLLRLQTHSQIQAGAAPPLASHHNSAEQVAEGLAGPLLVDPAPHPRAPPPTGLPIRVSTMGLGDSQSTARASRPPRPTDPASWPTDSPSGSSTTAPSLTRSPPPRSHLRSVRPGRLRAFPAVPVRRAPPSRHSSAGAAIVVADDPGTWAFHCHVLSHAEGPHRMFGMFSALYVD